MMKTIYGQVIDGKFKPLDKGELQNAFDGYEGCYVKVRVSSTHPKSKEQLGYYWGLMIPFLAGHFTYTEYEHKRLHEDIKLQVWNEERTNKVTGEVQAYARSLSEDDKEEMIEYIDTVTHWAWHSYNLAVPPPDKDWRKTA